MRKKLQVFVSSTYIDLKEERQAAVEAILSAGHIPAGMELFSAGSETQLEIVKRWIDESDIYLLILGGRYGSIEPKSQKSYTQLEYEYALQKDIPLFAIVINETALQKKVRRLGQDAVEILNLDKYKNFKGLVTSRICRFFDDKKDIKLSVFETLTDFQNRYKFSGWISLRGFSDYENLLVEGINLFKRFGNLDVSQQMEDIEMFGLPEPLGPKEEDKYITLANNGDKDAKSKLIERNLWLVLDTLVKLKCKEDEAEDLVSVGTIGLIRAVNTYRREFNVKLSDYITSLVGVEMQFFINRSKCS